MIHIENLNKRYGDTLALDGLNLHVGRGKFFVLLGPNGAGKTTTLKILSGLLSPSSGSVHVAGEDWSRPSVEAKRKVTYIPDFPFLYDKLTPGEFLQFIADVYGLPTKLAQEGIPYWLQTMELAREENKLIEHMSHGQRQRLVFAAALLPRPELIVVDEPMVGLDPRMKQKISRILKEKTKEGTTVFLSTHTLSLAEEMADEIAILDQGKCVAHGTLAQLRAQAIGASSARMEDIFLQLTKESGDQV